MKFKIMILLFLTMFGTVQILNEEKYSQSIEQNTNKLNVPDSAADSPISLVGNDALDQYCAGNGTDGLSWDTAHIIGNKSIEINSEDVEGISLTSISRFLRLINCTVVSNNLEESRYGLFLDRCSNIYVENSSFRRYYHGVFLSYSNNCTIFQNNITENRYSGCKASNSRNNTFLQNNMSNNFKYGLWISGLIENSIVRNNQFSFNGINGVELQSREYCFIINNTISYNEVDGISSDLSFLYDNYGNISENKIFRNGGYGINIDDVVNITVFKNLVYENGFSGIRFHYISEGNYALVQNNTVVNNGGDGIIGGSIACNNFIENNEGEGLYLTAIDTLAFNNSIRYNQKCGIFAYRSTTLDNNIIEGNFEHGIKISNTANISRNRIKNNHLSGIQMEDTSINNTIFENILEHNLEYGIARKPAESTDHIFLNNFTKNLLGALDTNVLSEGNIHDNIFIDALEASFLTNASSPTIGDRIQFTDTTTGGNGTLQYSWNFGDESPISHEQNPIHFYSAPVTYSVNLTVIDDDEDISTQVREITCIDLLPTASFSVNVSEIETEQSISFTDESVGGNGPLTYEWDFGDGTAFSEIQSPAHQYDFEGIFTVNLTVTDNDGDEASFTASVTVRVDLLPVANFSASSTTVYVGDIVIFQDTSSGGDFPLAYLWDFGDGTTSIEQNPTHLYSSTGSYQVILTVTDVNGDFNLHTVEIMVQEPLNRAQMSSDTGTIETSPVFVNIPGYSFGILIFSAGMMIIFLFRRKSKFS